MLGFGTVLVRIHSAGSHPEGRDQGPGVGISEQFPCEADSSGPGSTLRGVELEESVS